MDNTENNNTMNTDTTQNLFAPVDATVSASISPDNLTGFIYITPPENDGEMIKFDDILKALGEAGIKHGFNLEFLKSLAEIPVYNKNIEVAFGEPAINGIDGSIEVLFNNNHSKAPKMRDDGTVDFWELDLVTNVKKGDKLIQIIKATEGKEGIDVLGNPILPKPGKNPATPFGKNVIFSEDKTEIFASVDGNVTYANNQVAVDPTFRINGNVDASTGNITFNGDVIISGNVLDGFKVVAAKNISVLGMVESASLDAGGDITVNGGIIGSPEDKVHCKGNLKARFIENVTIRCEGDITSDYITNGDVICEGEMTLSGNKGALIGGKYVVLKQITCKDIGSENNARTFIQLGSFGMIQEEKERIEKQFKLAEENEKKVIQAIDYLNALKKANGSLDEQKEEMLRSAVQTKTKLLIEKSTLHKQLTALQARIGYEGKQQLVVKGTMYIGSQLCIKSNTFIPDRDIVFARFTYDEEKNEIVQGTV